MPDSLPLCVIDTSILIDLHAGGILQALFHLPMHLSAPDVLVEELIEPDGPSLLTHGLTSYRLSSDKVLEVHRLRAQYRRPSVNDLFALVLAKTWVPHFSPVMGLCVVQPSKKVCQRTARCGCWTKWCARG